VLPSHSKSAGPSPIVGAGARKGSVSISSEEWPTSPDEDIDRLVAIHLQQTCLSTSLGVSILTAGREDKNLLTQPVHINSFFVILVISRMTSESSWSLRDMIWKENNYV
jgi:hypothetical protein